jgi:NTP pyrophosphohydrolases including oxidative damage repair enzymes
MDMPKLLSSEMIYRGRVFTVYKEIFMTEKGETVIEVVRHRGAVAILPVLPDGRIVLEKQYRYSIRDFIYEVPAGTLEEKEKPESCAKRELTEETGFVAETLDYITKILMSPGYVDEQIYLFVARVKQSVSQTNLDRDEIIQTVIMKPEEAIEMIKNGKIIDSKTISLILLAKSLGYI